MWNSPGALVDTSVHPAAKTFHGQCLPLHVVQVRELEMRLAKSAEEVNKKQRACDNVQAVRCAAVAEAAQQRAAASEALGCLSFEKKLAAKLARHAAEEAASAREAGLRSDYESRLESALGRTSELELSLDAAQKEARDARLAREQLAAQLGEATASAARELPVRLDLSAQLAATSSSLKAEQAACKLIGQQVKDAMERADREAAARQAAQAEAAAAVQRLEAEAGQKVVLDRRLAAYHTHCAELSGNCQKLKEMLSTAIGKAQKLAEENVVMGGQLAAAAEARRSRVRVTSDDRDALLEQLAAAQEAAERETSDHEGLRAQLRASRQACHSALLCSAACVCLDCMLIYAPTGAPARSSGAALPTYLHALLHAQITQWWWLHCCMTSHRHHSIIHILAKML